VFLPDLMKSREITIPVTVTAANYFLEIVVDELL